jgi:cell division protein FtsL
MCAALWFIGSAALTTGTADKRQNIEMEIQHLKKQNAVLSASNSRLAQRIQALRTDERVIEQIAREELGMIRGDETIFLFPPEFNDQYASAQ